MAERTSPSLLQIRHHMHTLSSANLQKAQDQADDAASLGQSLLGAGLTPTMIRFLGHLPYFKVASTAMLPEGMGLAGIVVTTFVYALLCLGVNRWFSVRYAPFSATLALIAAMMVVGPAIVLALPAAPLPPNLHGYSGLMLPYLGMLLPVAGGFLAIQFIVGHHCHSRVTTLRLRAQANRK